MEKPNRPVADVLEGRPPLTLGSAVWFILKSQLSSSSQSRWLALGLPPWTPALIIFKKKFFGSPAIVEYPPCAGGCRRLNPCQPTRESAGRLSNGLRQLRHQAERYRELLQLKVRPQKSDGLEDAGLGLVLDDFDTRLAQGVLSFDFVGSGVVLGALAMHQGRKAQVGKLLFPAVGDDGLGGALEGHVAVLGGESVGGQAVHQAAAFHAADGGAPAVTRESVGDAGAERIGCIAPEILGVVFAGDAFFIVEAVDGLGVLAIGDAHEHVREGEANVTRVLGEAEAFPARV